MLKFCFRKFCANLYVHQEPALIKALNTEVLELSPTNLELLF